MSKAQFLFLAFALALPTYVSGQTQQRTPDRDRALLDCAVKSNLGNIRWIAALRQGKSGLSGDALNAAMFNAGNISTYGCQKNDVDTQSVMKILIAASYRYQSGLNTIKPQDAFSDCVITIKPSDTRLFVSSYDAAMLIVANAMVYGGDQAATRMSVEQKIIAALAPLQETMKLCSDKHQLVGNVDVISFYSRANWALRAEPVLSRKVSSKQGSE